MSDRDGGPAFPLAGGPQDQFAEPWTHGGMSLRDWYKGQALKAIDWNSMVDMAAGRVGAAADGESVKVVDLAKTIAKVCGAIADAMLAEGETRDACARLDALLAKVNGESDG